MGALDPFPGQDTSFVNVVVRIDPNWIHSGQRGGTPQGLMDSLTMVYGDQLEEGFTENVSASYASSDVVGRDEQYKTYTGTENRTIPITFRLMGHGSGSAGTEFLTHGDPTVSNEVIKPARWLESLQHAFPAPTGLSYAPPPLIITIGQLLVARAVMTECSIKWDSPFEPGSMLPHGATVQCTFTVVRSSFGNGESGGNAGGAPDYNVFLEFPTQGP